MESASTSSSPSAGTAASEPAPTRTAVAAKVVSIVVTAAGITTEVAEAMVAVEPCSVVCPSLAGTGRVARSCPTPELTIGSTVVANRLPASLATLVLALAAAHLLK